MTEEEFIKQRCEQCEMRYECAHNIRGLECLELNAVRDGIEWAWEHTENLWVSVHADLPLYDESVLVTSEKHPNEMWFCHRSNDKEHVETHEYDFCNYTGMEITHWMRVKQVK